MAIKDRYQNRKRILAVREFTDRKEPQQAFKSALSDNYNKLKVLVYYGIGGIGKTRLRKELVNLIDEDSEYERVKYAVIDFECENTIDNGKMLFKIRNILRSKYGIRFNSFDLVYSIYWQHINPQLDLRKENPQLFEDGSLITDIVATLGDIPVIGLVPKFIKIGERLLGISKRWWDRKGMKIINEIKDLDTKELLDILPEYLADDMNDYVVDNPEKIVIFFDTYEALWKNNRNNKTYLSIDTWLQSLIACSPSNILWVICGREKLRWNEIDTEWNEYLDQHLLDRLSEEDSIHFLESCGILDKQIQSSILLSSLGYPLYLDLSVDLYNKICEQGEVPIPKDFTHAPRENIERFMRYIDKNEAYTLETLSVANYWHYDLFKYLVEKAHTYYPVDAFQQLCKYSFIDLQEDSLDNETKIYKMNRLMRKELLENQAKDLNYRINQYIFDYYDNKVICIDIYNNKLSDEAIIKEWAYHASKVCSIDEFYKLSKERMGLLKNMGQLNSIIPVYEISLQEYKNDEDKGVTLGDINVELGQLYCKIGHYKLGEIEYRNAEKIYLTVLDKAVDECVSNQIKTKLIMLYIYYGDASQYERNEVPLSFYKKAINLINELTKTGNYDETLAVYKAEVNIKIGKLYEFFSENDLAFQAYNYALDSCKLILERVPDNPNVHSLNALALEKMGELISKSGDYEQAFNYYTDALSEYDKALKYGTGINYIDVITNQGLAYKRLASNLYKNNMIEESFKNHNEAISKYDEVIRLSPEYINAYKNKGFAEVDFMPILIKNGMFSETEEAYKLGVEAFNNAIQIFEMDAASINGIGTANIFLGDMYFKLGYLDKAEKLYNDAVVQCDTAAKTDPYYLYAYKDKGIAFDKLGDLYSAKHMHEVSKNFYDSALACFEEILKVKPKADYALHYKNEIIKKCC